VCGWGGGGGGGGGEEVRALEGDITLIGALPVSIKKVLFVFCKHM